MGLGPSSGKKKKYSMSSLPPPHQRLTSQPEGKGWGGNINKSGQESGPFKAHTQVPLMQPCVSQEGNNDTGGNSKSNRDAGADCGLNYLAPYCFFFI